MSDEDCMVYYCYNCFEELELEDKIKRNDACPHCDADLHCCLACKHYDENAHNKCKELVTAYIPDRAKANFCASYVLLEGERERPQDISVAKAKLDALFKKK